MVAKKSSLLNPKKSKERSFENMDKKREDFINTKEIKTFFHGSCVSVSTMARSLHQQGALTFTKHTLKIYVMVYYIVSSLMYVAPHFPSTRT